MEVRGCIFCMGVSVCRLVGGVGVCVYCLCECECVCMLCVCVCDCVSFLRFVVRVRPLFVHVT